MHSCERRLLIVLSRLWPRLSAVLTAPALGGMARLSWPGWQVFEYPRPRKVSTNRARRRATSVKCATRLRPGCDVIATSLVSWRLKESLTSAIVFRSDVLLRICCLMSPAHASSPVARVVRRSHSEFSIRPTDSRVANVISCLFIRLSFFFGRGAEHCHQS